MRNNLRTKPQKRKRTVRIERFAGTKANGKAAGLPFVYGETIPTKWHPGRAKDFASYRHRKSIVIGEPGRATEEAMVRMLRFEQQGADTRLFADALAGES